MKNSQSGTTITATFGLENVEILKMFKLHYHKSILKTSGLLRASRSCFIIQSFISKNNSVEKYINIQQVLSLSFLKMPGLKNKQQKKRIIKINYLIIALITIRLLILLVFSQYGLACKYGIIFQISIHY